MNKTSGFSLVELMVGMLVGLIGTMVIFQVFAISEGQKRTTTSGGDASQSAAFALFSLERELRVAGQGFNNNGLLGCSIRVYDDDSPPPKSRLQGLVPAVITAGAGNLPDQLSISFVSSDIVNPPSQISADVSGNGTISVDDRGFYQPGDVLVLSQLDDTGNNATVAGVPHHCAMFRVTALPALTKELAHAPAPGNYIDPTGSSRPIRFNHPAGIDNGWTPAGLTFAKGVTGSEAGGYVYNMGNALSSATYSIVNNQLMRNDDMTSASATNPAPIADGIVQMKVLYGIDTPPFDSQISASEWTKISPATPAGWQRLLAVKLALVARSALREKADPVTGLCTVTEAAPQWYGAGTAGVDIPLDVSADPDWKCYRYKVFQTIVPLRNMAWKPVR
ncbi:MAG: PilW family protein [Betaproteobacteria bacterium]|nr:PilW family protein [Betaproteobacteria bacterium]